MLIKCYVHTHPNGLHELTWKSLNRSQARPTKVS